MKNIVEYIQEHVFEHPQMMPNIYENYNVIKMYFEDKDIPDFCNELLTQNYSASYIINEYLKSVNATKTIERIKNDLSSNILSIKSDNNMIYIVFDDYDNIDKDKFENILNTYKYIIHTRIANKLILEPLVEKNCNDYIYKDCNGIVFHLTDKENVNKILKVGLRPKYVKHETINNLKDKQYNNIDYKGKIYVAAINDLSTVKYKIKEIKDKLFKNNNNVKVLKIRLPNNIDFYKDNAMYDDISYFTYTPIDSKYIEITNYQYILLKLL